MKSKKLVALALTAAMTISMASTTAFAAVTYTDGGADATLEKVTAAIKITKEEAAELDVNGDNKITLDELNLKDYTDLNTGTKTFTGWAKSEKKSGANVAPLAGTTVVVANVKSAPTTVASGMNKLIATYTTTTDDEQIAKNLKAIEERKAKQDAAKTRDEHLKEEDKNHNATDNINTGTGVETKAAKVERKTAPIDPTDNTSEYHDLKAAGVDVDANELAWVYEVTPPDGFMKTTKNARVQLTLPEGYTTSNYKVTVYHVKGWCSKQKVTGLDVGTYDVAFWANDFSPYVLILTPKGATSTSTSTNNPGTGDFSAVPVALLAAAALGATGFVAYKKRKAE